MTDLRAYEFVSDSSRVLLVRACPVCSEEQKITGTRAGLDAYLQGAFVQDAFPTLTPDQREVLVSGTCAECWAEMWGED